MKNNWYTEVMNSIEKHLKKRLTTTDLEEQSLTIKKED